MKINKEIEEQIFLKAHHESVPYISLVLNVSESSVCRIIKKYNIKKLPLNQRNESIEYIAYRHKIELDELKEIINNLTKYKKPLPLSLGDKISEKITKKYGKSMSPKTWNYLMDNLSIQQLDYVKDNYTKFPNRVIARDLNLKSSAIVSKIGKIYNLVKPDVQELYCEVCRINKLPPKEYKSNTSCKKCWSKRMSEYQYIYYPTSKRAKK